MQELVIKVPAPFPGVEDLGFTARYPEQAASEPLRDVPFFVEGPAKPMSILVERLALFADKDSILDAHGDGEAYAWTPPIQLTDEVCVMAFRDRSVRTDSAPADDTAGAVRSYVWNLVRPLAFTFLQDCVRIGHLRLSERIAVVLDTGHPPAIDLEMQRTSITPFNGDLLLFRA
ncbi:MAG: hypothetical protein JOZ75_09730 [Candidatus Dormibacteraeota bacterium]|nr:hypothetical protein [Candidatus Dormibacteraeota bacterium]